MAVPTNYYKLTGGVQANGGKIGRVDTTAAFPVGMRCPGTDAVGAMGEYIYLAGCASTIVGSVVTFDELGATTLLAANAVGPCAVACAITDATTKYGWYGIAGTFPTDVVANCADNALLGRETSDGKVGDGCAAGDAMYGAVSRAATTAAAVVNCQFMYPSVNDKSA